MNASEQRLYEQMFGDEANPPRQLDLIIQSIDCFADKGFHATTTRDITKRTKMSPAGLYVHFKDKHAVLFRIVLKVATALHNRLQEAAMQGGSPTERLARIVRAHVRAHAEMHTAVKVANLEFDSLLPEERQEVLNMRDKTEEIYRNCLADGVTSGHFNIRDIHIAELALYSLVANVSQWFQPTGKYNPDQIADLYVDLALGMINPPHLLRVKPET